MVQTENMTTLSWTRFLQIFNEKYLGEAVRAGKVYEFLNLHQGKMSVAEYAMKFEELARFSPLVVPTDEARKSKFIYGLRTEIAKYIDLGTAGSLTYAEAVQRVIRLDSWDKKRDSSLATTSNPTAKRVEVKAGQDSYG